MLYLFVFLYCWCYWGCVCWYSWLALTKKWEEWVDLWGLLLLLFSHWCWMLLLLGFIGIDVGIIVVVASKRCHFGMGWRRFELCGSSEWWGDINFTYDRD